MRQRIETKSERNKQIVEMAKDPRITLREIAEKFHISQARVSYIIERAQRRAAQTI